MKTKATLILLFIVSSCFSQVDTSLCSYFTLKNSDVIAGKVLSESSDSIIIDEFKLGIISLSKKDIQNQQVIDKGNTVSLEFSNDTRYTGKLNNISDSGLVIFSEYNSSEIYFPYSSLTSISISHKPIKSYYVSNSTRYFFAPSAFSLDKGSGYYQNAYLISNSVNYGVNNSFTMGGGVIIPFLFFANPKISFKLGEKFRMAAGCIIATTLMPDENITGGIPFLLGTYGTTNHNLTLGAGYGLIWVDKEFDYTEYPIMTLNYMKKVSARLSLISENWFIPFNKQVDQIRFDMYGNPIPNIEPATTEKLYMALSLGLRISLGKQSSVDFTPVFISGETNIVLPYLDFVYTF